MRPWILLLTLLVVLAGLDELRRNEKEFDAATVTGATKRRLVCRLMMPRPSCCYNRSRFIRCIALATRSVTKDHAVSH